MTIHTLLPTLSVFGPAAAVGVLLAVYGNDAAGVRGMRQAIMRALPAHEGHGELRAVRT